MKVNTYLKFSKALLWLSVEEIPFLDNRRNWLHGWVLKAIVGKSAQLVLMASWEKSTQALCLCRRLEDTDLSPRASSSGSVDTDQKKPVPQTSQGLGSVLP